jgi:hypothetical protein
MDTLLYVDTAPSQTVTAVITNGSAQVGATINLSESGTIPGRYTASIPSLSAGHYSVIYYAGAVVVATATLHWDGSTEINPGLFNTRWTATLAGYLSKIAFRYGIGTKAVHSPTGLTTANSGLTQSFTPVGTTVEVEEV